MSSLQHRVYALQRVSAGRAWRGIAVLPISCLLAACQPKPIATDVAASVQRPSDTCVSPTTFEEVKGAIFDEAQKRASGANKLALQQIGVQSRARIDMAVLDEFNADTQKTSCSGRMRLSVPAGAIAELGDGTEITLDIKYTAQPSADGASTVYTVLGAQDLIAGLSVAEVSNWASRAATAALEAQPAEPMLPAPVAPVERAPAEDPPAAFQTSFDCNKARSYAEVTICSTAELAVADRQLAETYRLALAADQTGQVRSAARLAWRAREACRSLQCLREWYARRRLDLENVVG